MINAIVFQNINDVDGNPAGGTAEGTGVKIEWQDGPRGNGANLNPPNGAFVEDIIELAVERLKFFQESKFKCRENSLAITKLEEALMWLDRRRQDRRKRGVEGTHNV